MKLNFYTDAVESIWKVHDGVYASFDGVVYCKGDEVNLDLYQGGVDQVNYEGSGFIAIGSVLNKQPIFIVDAENHERINLPLNIEGDVRWVTYIDRSYVVFSKGVTRRKKTALIFSRYEDINIEIKGGGHSYVFKDDRIIRKEEGGVAAYNWKSERIWKYEFAYLPDGTNTDIEYINGKVIFNCGDKLVCLKTDDGSLVWEAAYGSQVDNHQNINEKIYLASGNRMLVLAPESGEVLLDFKADINDTEGTTLWTDGVLLYVMASKSNMLQAYSQEGELIKSYTLPDHPRLKHGAKTFHHNGVNYLGLVRGNPILAGVEGGLLTWTADDILAGKEIEFEERPAISIMTAADDQGSESYYVTIPSTDIHEIIRFGEITARKIAALRGEQFCENEDTINKKFGGQIVLIIDDAVSEENKPYLDMLVKRSNFFCNNIMNIKSGDGKHPINVSWEYASAC